MSESNSNRKPRGLKPVEQVEVSEKHVTLRFVLMAVFLLIAIVAIWYGVTSFLKVEPGLQEVSANTTGDRINCAQDLTFYYNFGKSGMNSVTEKKALQKYYAESSVDAYSIFRGMEEISGYSNLATVNAHPNEEVTVEPALYEALKTVSDENALFVLYLAPVYELYENVFASGSDYEASLCDVSKNEETRAFMESALPYLLDEKHLKLSLLPDNRVKLTVSKAYAKFAEENGITRFLDFGWLLSAAEVDYIADALIEKGHRYGEVHSFDGFARNFDESGETYSVKLYDVLNGKTVEAAVYQYTSPMNLVNLHSMMLADRDFLRFYEYADGTTVTPYVGTDGYCHSAVPSMLCTAKDASCLQIACRMASAYVRDELDADAVSAMKADGIYSVYTDRKNVYYNDPDAAIGEIYYNDTVTYGLKLLK